MKGTSISKDMKDKILNDASAVEEINKFKWIESEKAKHDIGFDEAARRWMEAYGSNWVKAQEDKKAPKASSKSSCCAKSSGKKR